MEKIFVVIGANGMYDDHREWLVRAFPTKRRAANFIEKLELSMEAFKGQEGHKPFDGGEWVKHLKQSMASLDPKIQWDDGQPDYSVEEVPFQ